MVRVSRGIRNCRWANISRRDPNGKKGLTDNDATYSLDAPMSCTGCSTTNETSPSNQELNRQTLRAPSQGAISSSLGRAARDAKLTRR
jgi:hypothetical protein